MKKKTNDWPIGIVSIIIGIIILFGGACLIAVGLNSTFQSEIITKREVVSIVGFIDKITQTPNSFSSDGLVFVKFKDGRVMTFVNSKNICLFGKHYVNINYIPEHSNVIVSCEKLKKKE